MSTLSDRLQTLSAADEFFELFRIEVDPHVVHVNRLHILKRFHDYLKRAPVQEGLSEADEFAAYRERLVQAYLDAHPRARVAGSASGRGIRQRLGSSTRSATA